MALAAPFPAAGTRQTRPARHGGTVRTRGTDTSLRLTPRGRLVLGIGSALVLLLVVVVSGAFRADAGASASAQGVATSVVVVQPGENLWQLANEVMPEVDPREAVLRIRELNGLGDEPVRPGQSLVVPAGR
jgi:hypothetical protein